MADRDYDFFDDDRMRAGGDPSVYGRSEVRRMLRDEIGRNEVRRVLRRRAYFSHPLVVWTVAALIAVAAVAWIVLAEIDRLEVEQARRDALAAVDAIAQASATHIERLDLFAAAVARGDAEATALKTRYDESRVAWRGALVGAGLRLRAHFGSARATFLDDAVALSLERLFELSHRCVMEAHGRRTGPIAARSAVDAIATERAAAGLDACLARRGAAFSGDRLAHEALAPRLRRCQEAIVDALAQAAFTGLRCEDETIWRRRIEPGGSNEPSIAAELYENVMNACEVGDAPPLRRLDDAARAKICVPAPARRPIPRLDLSPPALDALLPESALAVFRSGPSEREAEPGSEGGASPTAISE